MLLLNSTRTEPNINYNVIPQLHMPKLINNFMIEEYKHLLNLKDVIQAHNITYYNTARNTLIRHENMSKYLNCVQCLLIFGSNCYYCDNLFLCSNERFRSISVTSVYG